MRTKFEVIKLKNQISIQDDYVFGSVMSNAKLCHHLIQLILPELKIQRIEFPTLQKAINNFHNLL